MGVYRRKDSPFWWMHVESTGRRASTGIVVDAGSPAQAKENRRQADVVYARAVSDAVLAPPAAPPKPVISYRAHAQWYATHHAAHLRGAGRVRSILAQLAPHFDRFGDLRDLTSAHIREWMTHRRREVAPATVNRELDVLKSLLHLAVPRYLDASPASEVRRFRVEERDIRILTREEEARLLAVASPADKAWLLLSLDTLLRLGNTVRLRWPQVRLQERVLVPLNAKVALDTSPLSKRVVAALKQLPRDDGWVFPQFHTGEGPTAAENAAKRAFARLCQLARVDHGRAINGVTVHSLRHTGATRALQGGAASMRTVQRLGGWRSSRMVERYVHVAEADLRAAVETIGARERRPRSREQHVNGGGHNLP